MKIDPQSYLVEICLRSPEAIAVFESFNLNYLYGGNLSLVKACEQAGIPVEKVIPFLEKLEASGVPGLSPPGKEAPLSELIDFIMEKFHEPAYPQLSALKALSTTSKKNNAERDKNILRLDVHVHETMDQLNNHMREEEAFLFPYLKETEKDMEKGKIPNPKRLELPLQNGPLRVFAWEHEIAEKEFLRMRTLTNDYTPPPDADDSLKTLFRNLRRLDVETGQHVHLENNILFQKAIQLKILN